MDEADGNGRPDPPATAGDVLRAAREARGLTLDQVADRTRIARRQLDAIETGNYASLPSPTYAVGFAKAFARVVGADEVAIAAQVRNEVSRYDRPTPSYQPYEAPDPSRVPSRALAIVAAGIALAILILAGLFFGTDLFRGGSPRIAVSAPVPAPAAPPRPASVAGAAPAAAPMPGGQVRLAATRADVWLRVYDAAGKTLYLGTLKQGDHFDVPAGADHPMVNVGRADELLVTLDGRPAPPLGDGKHAIKDVPVDPAAIAARIAGSSAAPSIGASAAPSASPSAAPSPSPSAASTTTAMSQRSSARPSSAAARPRRARRIDETARANLDAASPPPAAGNSQ